MLKLSVDIDTSSSERWNFLFFSTNHSIPYLNKIIRYLLVLFFIFSRLEKIVIALRAAAEYSGLPVKNCVLVAGSQSGVSAAKMVGMPCVVMRSRYGFRFLMSLFRFLLLIYTTEA